MAKVQDGEEVMDAGELPLLKLGDASVAAPFTSKRPSIVSVYDIIRQGRCTLVARVQNNQITCLTCIISSYSLSVLHLEGVKFSDYQLTLSGMLLMMCHLSLSYSTPLEKISAARPLGSMFHPALFVSLVGQFVLHLICMMAAVNIAKTYLPSDYTQDPKGKFTPSLVNTVVFLVQTMQQVSVLMVNYKGRPFQPALTESKALLNALGICGIGLLVCAYEVLPSFNTGIGMVPLPSDELRQVILGLLVLDIMGTFIWDRFCVWLWAPELSKASSAQFNSYTMFITARKLAVTCLALALLVKDGSLVSLFAIGYMYRQGYF
jgi:cation-transporting ATPase 13A1